MTDSAFDAAAEARRVLRLASTGALATLALSGAPFASLVTVATSAAGEPVFLLSDLALHTKNLARDPRASLLLVAPGGEGGDPLAGARLTVSGRMLRDADPALRRRILARHEEAAGYAGFADFAVWRLAVEGAHLVAGFGRIVALEPADLLTAVADAGGLLSAEESAVAHMNADHADALALYATRLLGAPEGAWRATGADPDGLDLRAGAQRARLAFPNRGTTGAAPPEARVALAREARARPV